MSSLTESFVPSTSMGKAMAFFFADRVSEDGSGTVSSIEDAASAMVSGLSSVLTPSITFVSQVSSVLSR